MVEESKEKNMSPEEEVPKSLRRAHHKAQTILRDHEKIEQLLKNATEKARTHRQRIRKVWSEVQLLIRMIRAYKSGEYRRIPWKAIVMIVAAIIYFVNPLDIIPDFLFGIGFLDDATVIGLVMKTLTDEIEKFKVYLQRKEGMEEGRG